MKKTLLTTAVLLTTIAGVRADHGPGTSGSGFTTQTAETIQLGKWGATVSHDWTEFGGLNSNLPANADHLDLIDRSHLTTFGLSLGVTQNLQLGLNFGYYAASGTRQLVHNHGADEHEDGHHSDEHHAEGGHGHSAESIICRSAFARTFWSRVCN